MVIYLAGRFRGREGAPVEQRQQSNGSVMLCCCSVHLGAAACFVQMGRRVLLVGIDPQGSALDWVAALRSPDGDGTDVPPPLYDAVLRYIRYDSVTISGLEVDEATNRRTSQSWFVEVVRG